MHTPSPSCKAIRTWLDCFVGDELNMKQQLAITSCMIHLQIDLHRLTLEKARKKIRNFIRRMHTLKATRLTLVHGFNRGTVLRNYIRNGDMVSELIAMGVVKRILFHKFSNPGKTTFDIIHTDSLPSLKGTQSNIGNLTDIDELLAKISEMNDDDDDAED